MNSCRLCLKEFLAQQNDCNVDKMKVKFQLVFSFEIISNERLPKEICPDCVGRVSQFYDYADVVHKNQLKLYSQIENESMCTEPSGSSGLDKPELFPIMPEEEIKIEPQEEFLDDPIETKKKKTVATKKTPAKVQADKFEKNLINRYLDMVCDICKEDLFTYQKLEVHFKKYHGRRCYIACCGLKLTSEQMISDHLGKHMSVTKENDSQSSWERRVATAFGSILTDFKRDLEDYEPLPNMELALKGDTNEQQKMYNVQDYLVQSYFSLNCELCAARINNLDDRRIHFRRTHPRQKYFVSCCSQRFSTRISIMRHLNRHWKHVASGNELKKPAVHYKSDSLDGSEAANRSTSWVRQLQTTYGPLMNEFRDDLVEGGFTPPTKLPETKSAENSKLLHQMQDFLIAKHSPLNCDLCGVEIKTYVGRRDHFRIGHPKEKLYVQCCGKKIFTRYKIILHLLRHRKGLPTTGAYDIRNTPVSMYDKHERDDVTMEAYYKMDCELCDYTGNSYLGLRDHFQKKHKEEGFFIKCCNRRLKTKYHILEHIAGHQKPGSVKCDHCDATFSSLRMRKAHVSRKHVSEEEKIYRCEHCVASFATRNLLVLHTYKHELMTCDICGVEMKRCSLRVHKLNFHKMGEEIVCHVCAEVFHSKHMFNAHHRKAHLGIRKKYKKKSRAKKKPVIAEQALPTSSGEFSTGVLDELKAEPLC
ncbi:zinc finger protein 26-like [Topomyia yanbarensis]|uniref:zinc finger protein 26-like n=1 Tax=Topomyia yanbarensis TaxID=2498891 RepID=UPI00273BB5E4|nr:zinc finger protein 26-like [Topomyia yanbarensis]